MNRKGLDYFLRELHATERGVSTSKGTGYANDDADALANFKRVAKNLGLTPLHVCFVYMSKHFDSLASYARLGKEVTGEGISGRVVDLRLYAALFLALANEAELEKHERKDCHDECSASISGTRCNPVCSHTTSHEDVVGGPGQRDSGSEHERFCQGCNPVAYDRARRTG